MGKLESVFPVLRRCLRLAVLAFGRVKLSEILATPFSHLSVMFSAVFTALMVAIAALILRFLMELSLVTV